MTAIHTNERVEDLIKKKDSSIVHIHSLDVVGEKEEDDDAFSCRTDLTTVKASNVRRVRFAPTTNTMQRNETTFDEELARSLRQLLDLLVEPEDHAGILAYLRMPFLRRPEARRGSLLNLQLAAFDVDSPPAELVDALVRSSVENRAMFVSTLNHITVNELSGGVSTAGIGAPVEAENNLAVASDNIGLGASMDSSPASSRPSDISAGEGSKVSSLEQPSSQLVEDEMPLVTQGTKNL